MNYLNTQKQTVLTGIIICLLMFLFISGCKTMEAVTQIGASLGVETGIITKTQADSIKRSTTAVARSFEDFTPEQEYYIGRTVGASIASKYKPYSSDAANMYLNTIGKALAQASDMPETFGGYHFLILDSDEINAFAAPGGFIFVTRGILRCCKTEDAVASILAHEIGHIQAKHGLQAIKKSRITNALSILALESAKSFGDQNLADLTRTFEGSVSDITSTLINSGYSRAFERDADKAAVTIMKRVGYNPASLIDMLEMMKKNLKPGGVDFAKTHPSPDSRIADIQRLTGTYKEAAIPAVRQARFGAVPGIGH